MILLRERSLQKSEGDPEGTLRIVLCCAALVLCHLIEAINDNGQLAFTAIYPAINAIETRHDHVKEIIKDRHL
ncbi:MAG: hypothetical protein H8E44_24875 [Planctomycetes bacterium]|nr:hypothetical protein [Planctomycetota bacterium]MBL7037493.1 hypothetical protein [Pirellulaceae bacterium]